MAAIIAIGVPTTVASGMVGTALLPKRPDATNASAATPMMHKPASKHPITRTGDMLRPPLCGCAPSGLATAAAAGGGVATFGGTNEAIVTALSMGICGGVNDGMV